MIKSIVMKTPSKDSVKDDSKFNVTDVNFSDFKISKKEIRINGKALPLKIGDRIKFSDANGLAKTVMGITIHEDSRVQYILEWLDPNSGSFQSEALTMQELKLIAENQATPKRQKMGFGA